MTDSASIETTTSPAFVGHLRALEVMRVAMIALTADRALRNGLRFVAGVSGLFMPEPSTIDALVKLGLVEPCALGVCVGMLDDYRPTGLGSELLPAIGVRG